MNILITLQKNLIDKILSGEKKFEMRKSVPKNMKIGEDGFFVVEKGTKDVRCWCRVDRCVGVTMTDMAAVQYASVLGVSWSFVLNYAPIGKKVYMWQIGKVMELQDLCRDSLCIDKNPQQFAYCPLSYGESF